jgi:hypothetical protein
MFRMLGVSALVLVFSVSTSSAQAPPAPEKATPQNAAAFVGEWELNAQGQTMPVTFGLSITPEGAALKAALTLFEAPQTVTDISRAGTSLLVTCTIDYQGNSMPMVITLTPSGDKVLAQMDVANGTSHMEGTATRKGAK